MPLSNFYEKCVQSQAACLWLFADSLVCKLELFYVLIGQRKEQKFELKLARNQKFQAIFSNTYNHYSNLFRPSW